jgi:hypothetical protein
MRKGQLFEEFRIRRPVPLGPLPVVRKKFLKIPVSVHGAHPTSDAFFWQGSGEVAAAVLAAFAPSLDRLPNELDGNRRRAEPTRRPMKTDLLHPARLLFAVSLIGASAFAAEKPRAELE